MNKKALAALVGTLAFGTATVTAYAGDKAAPAEKDAKAPAAKEKGKDDAKPADDKAEGKGKGKGKDKGKDGKSDSSCSGAGGCSGKK